MKLKRFAMLSCLTAGLLLSSASFAPSAWAQTTVQVSNKGATYTAQGTFTKSSMPASGIPAFVTVSDASNNIYFAGQTDTEKDGIYHIEWTMPTQASSGTYTVKVSIDGDVQTATFTYTVNQSSDDSTSYTGIDDSGPIRFTGELNSGHTQAVIYNTDTGVTESVVGDQDNVTLDPTRAQYTIATAPYGTSYLTISVPSNTSDTTVTVPGSIVTKMINAFGPTSHLLVATYEGNYDLPLDSLNSQILSKIQSASDGSLKFHMAAINRDQTYLNQISYLPARDLKDPYGVSFDLTATYNAQSLPIKDFGHSYVKYSINLAGAHVLPTSTQSVLMVNPKNASLVPTPSTLYHDIVGHLKLVITRTGNGAYYPIEAGRSFQDLSGTSNRSEIETLAARGVISGVSSTSFDPYGQITRAQFATLMVRALGLSDKQGSTLFTDVPSRTWYTDYVAIGSSLGLISGYTNYQFAPNDPISREQVAALLARGLQFVRSRPYVDTARVLSPITDQGNIDSWARDDVALALQTGILDSGTLTVQPRRLATRSESAHMLYNLLRYLKFIQ